MNIHKLLLALFGFTLILGCEEEYIAPTQFAHPVITTTQTTVNINGDISFADIGQGAITRKWSFPEGAVDILNSENDLESSEKIVHAIFLKPGDYEVNFKADYVVDSVKMDSAIVVTVLDSITAKFTSDITQVEAGEFVSFTDQSTGTPDQWTWNFEGAEPATSNEQNPSVKYKALGKFGVTLVAFRDEPWGRDTVTVEKLIEVIPSTKPVTLDKVAENENDEIELYFSREIDALSVNKADFSVSFNGNPAEVSEAFVNPDDKTIVVVKTTEMIKNSYEVLISYTKGALKTTDFVEADAFTDAIAENYIINLVPENAGFETGDETGWNGWGDGSHEVSEAAAHSGKFGMHITRGAADYSVGTGDGGDIELKAGVKYRITFWTKTITGDNLWHFCSMNKKDPWGTLGQQWYPTNAEWGKVVKDVNGEDWSDAYFINVLRATGEFYLDDVKVFELEE
ncbi:PKD domain-containing protein [Flexithrix dorotheae]|uniref:PKD domain-containing protein n=1 Tax=Flexithrix dorotheae TaxID=70993 RepID=UPI0003680D80|nr:PKD domain-containing protein [Flexithrix dorotheae]